MLHYQILAYTIHENIHKSHMRTANLKYQLQLGMENFNYLMDLILHQIFKIFILSIILKNMKERLSFNKNIYT